MYKQEVLNMINEYKQLVQSEQIAKKCLSKHIEINLRRLSIKTNSSESLYWYCLKRELNKIM